MEFTSGPTYSSHGHCKGKSCGWGSLPEHFNENAFHQALNDLPRGKDAVLVQRQPNPYALLTWDQAEQCAEASQRIRQLWRWVANRPGKGQVQEGALPRYIIMVPAPE